MTPATGSQHQDAAATAHPSATTDRPSSQGERALARRVLASAQAALSGEHRVEFALSGDPPSGAASARVVFRSPGALGRALWPPTADALGDAYLRGDFEIEGDIAAVARAGTSFDLSRLGWVARLALACRVLTLRRQAEASPPILRRARLHGRRHSVGRDRAAVRFHYDVGNRFYALWLDRSMTYSCAYFASPQTDLDGAQRAKLDLVCRKLALRPGDRLLDIGSGWGSLIAHATEHYAVTALGVTLSEAQARYTNDQAAEQGLADRCVARVLDYRELRALGTFDAVASIGMFEHVGRANLPDYFAAAYRALRPGGLFLNHGIAETAPAAWRLPLPHLGTDFVGAHVFPDGELVTVPAASAAARRAGFELIDLQSLRPHYALTLAAWLRRLEAAREVAIAEAGEEVYRTWRLYLAGAQMAFERGELDVAQLLLARPGPGAPAERALRPWW